MFRWKIGGKSLVSGDTKGTSLNPLILTFTNWFMVTPVKSSVNKTIVDVDCNNKWPIPHTTNVISIMTYFRSIKHTSIHTQSKHTHSSSTVRGQWCCSKQISIWHSCALLATDRSITGAYASVAWWPRSKLLWEWVLGGLNANAVCWTWWTFMNFDYRDILGTTSE